MKKRSGKSSNPPEESLIKVGKILGPHSLKGEVRILVFAGEAPWMDSMEEVCLKAENREPQVRQVEYFRDHGGKIHLKMSGIDDRTAAEELKGLEIWIPESLFVSREGDAIYLREILNFVVENEGVRVGVVDGFESNMAQDLLIVKLDSAPGEKALVPLVKEFLVAIDYDSRIIKMKLPEGLLEANRAL